MVRVAAINPIIIKGNQMFDSITKRRFFMRGIAYDPMPFAWPGGGDCTAGDAEGYDDPNTDVLADDFTENDWTDWEDDLEQIASMNVNTIRLYHIDPTKPHERFMAKAESLGKPLSRNQLFLYDFHE